MKPLNILLFLSLFFYTLQNPCVSHTEYQKFKNKDFNYSILIPSSWKMFNLNLEAKNVMYAALDKNTEIKVKVFKSSDKDINKIADETKWDLRHIDPMLFKIIETKKVKIKKNISGKLLVFEYRIKGSKILNRVMITTNSGNIYIIECKSPVRNFYKYDNYFTTAMSSFNFIEATGDSELEEEKDSGELEKEDKSVKKKETKTKDSSPKEKKESPFDSKSTDNKSIDDKI
jgi:hypothetical protein